MLADDTQAVAIYDATSTIGGQTQTHRFVLVEAMTPEGKAATTHILAFDQLAVDAHFNR